MIANQSSHVAPIDYQIHEAQGSIRVGDVLSAEMAPYRSADGKPTKLVDSIFSTIPGSPAYVAKASHHQVNLPEFDFVWEYSGKNAIQGAFRFEGAGLPWLALGDTATAILTSSRCSGW